MRKAVLLMGAALVWLALSSFTTVHLMGDSTMAEKDLPKAGEERGWGMMFQNFLDPSQVQVINYAQNGRSTKSFRDLGLWDKVYNAVQPGDYVFIQFGHNDSKESDPERYAAPWGAYQDNLRLFIDGVREKGGTPVLLTPVARRWFKEKGLDRGCHGDYPAAMKAVAAEKDVTLLDVTTPTLDWLEGLGDEASKAYFMISTGKNDNTHLVPCGARKVTEIVCGLIKEQIPELAQHLVYYNIVISADGHGDYQTVQEGVNAIPDYSHKEITKVLIRNGVYKEEISIPHTKFRVHFKGEDAGKTILTYDKYAKKLWPGRDFPVGTSGSASVYIHASYITFEDICFENSAGEGKEIGQAVAVFTDGDFLFFNRCRFLGNQDTLYTYGRFGKFGGIKRNYFKDCYIEGTTDFIFGTSIAYFEGCEIRSKKNSYVTAASTLEGQKYGYVFYRCKLTADEGVTQCYLGRPWGAYAKTVFIECELGGHILPEGWHDWEKDGKPDTKKNSYYAEYNNYGPGADGKRVKWSHRLNARQAEEYSFEKVMYQSQDGIVWDPYNNK